MASATEIAQCQEELRSEEQARELASTSGTGWTEEQKVASAEVAVLHEAASTLDAERDETQRLADLRAQEAADMQDAIQVHQRMLQEVQQAIDDLRAGSRAENLDQHRGLLVERRHLLQELSARCSQLREEAKERSNEATSVLEDLMHMTKENQEQHHSI